MDPKRKSALDFAVLDFSSRLGFFKPVLDFSTQFWILPNPKQKSCLDSANSILRFERRKTYLFAACVRVGKRSNSNLTLMGKLEREQKNLVDSRREKLRRENKNFAWVDQHLRTKLVLRIDAIDAMYANAIDARFQLGATHLVAGSTGSGKTTYVIKILRIIVMSL